MQKETIEKAAQCAELLCDDVRAAHKSACQDIPSAVEILLLDLIGECTRIRNRLKEIKECVQ